jgi:hypothetical protein
MKTKLVKIPTSVPTSVIQEAIALHLKSGAGHPAYNKALEHFKELGEVIETFTVGDLIAALEESGFTGTEKDFLHAKYTSVTKAGQYRFLCVFGGGEDEGEEFYVADLYVDPKNLNADFGGSHVFAAATEKEAIAYVEKHAKS